MTELVRMPSQSLPAKLEYARTLADSGLLPAQYRAKPANILYAMEYGEALGISPMAAITGVHVIEGKPSASANLIGALVRRAGHKLRVTGDEKACTATIIRSDDPEFEFTVTWTIEMARAAGLAGKGTWQKFPQAMLKARAISQVARDACEEALFGLHYTPEELGVETDGDGNVIGGTVVSAPPLPSADAIRQAVTEAKGQQDPLDALRQVYRRFGKDALQAVQVGDGVTAEAYLLGEVEKANPVEQPAATVAAEAPAVDDVVDAVLVEDAPSERTPEQVAEEVGGRIIEQGEQLNAQADARAKAEASPAGQAAPAPTNAPDVPSVPVGDARAEWLEEAAIHARALDVAPQQYVAPLLEHRGAKTLDEVDVEVLGLWLASRRKPAGGALRRAGQQTAAERLDKLGAKVPGSRARLFDAPAEGQDARVQEPARA